MHEVTRSACSTSRTLRLVIALIACAAFPLFALLVFGLVQAGVYELATREVSGVGVLRAMPAFWGSQFVSQPTEEPARAGRRFYIYSGSMGSHVLRDLWSLFTLDPNVVGATRREALTMVGSGYAAAVLVCAASTVIGLWLGQCLCGVVYRPSYWSVGAVRREQQGMLRDALLPAALGAYPVMVALAAINVLCVDTLGTGIAPAMPSLTWAFVLLSAPAVSGAAWAMREYTRVVRSRIGSEEYLCDCDYECRPGQVCPECGTKTRELPATLRWRLPVWKGRT